MRRLGVFILLAGAAVIGATALYLMFSGPRMRVQPKIVPSQWQMPAMPQGIVPVSLDLYAVPSPDMAEQLRNPLPDTEHTRRTGQVYYGYYCAVCHGSTGRGNGTVGVSYTPVPTDLTSPQVQTLSDGSLYRAMLAGVGHEPVLGYTIDPKQRWYIVSYVRHLQSGQLRGNKPTAPQ